MGPETHPLLIASKAHVCMSHAIRAHPQQTQLQENALGLLARLTPYHSDKVAIITEDVLRAVLDCLSHFPGASTLQTYGCVILLSHVSSAPPLEKVGRLSLPLRSLFRHDAEIHLGINVQKAGIDICPPLSAATGRPQEVVSAEADRFQRPVC